MAKTRKHRGRGANFMDRIQAQQDLACTLNIEFARIQCRDMLIIALNEALGFGSERVQKFLAVYDEVFDYYAELTLSDARDDSKMDYTKGKLDAKIKSIVGDENFEPWEVRYGKLENRGRFKACE